MQNKEEKEEEKKGWRGRGIEEEMGKEGEGRSGGGGG